MALRRSDSKRAPGLSANIVKCHSGKYSLEVEVMDEIFRNESLRDVKIAVISTSGAMHCGKSLTQNYFYGHLHQMKSSITPRDTDIPKRCFDWGNGVKYVPKTVGIHITRKPVIFNRQGEKIAVFLLDTEGLNMKAGPLQHFLFVLSTMMSSVQIINVEKDIQEKDVYLLKSFLRAYEELKQCSDGEVFESDLMFLVRDFADTKHKAGKVTCQEFLSRLHQSSHRRLALEKLTKVFSHLDFFCMPHPGSKATVKQVKNEFRGSYRELNDSFVHYLKELMDLVLHKDRFVLKRTNATAMTCSDYAFYIENCFNALSKRCSDPCPALIQIIAHYRYQPLVDECEGDFHESMISDIREHAMDDDEFQEFWDRKRSGALRRFDDEALCGSLMNEKQEFFEKLEESIDKLEDEMRAHNERYFKSSEEKNRKALRKSEQKYTKELRDMMSRRGQLNANDLEEHHKTAKDVSMSLFERLPKQGGVKFIEKYRNELRRSIHEEYQERREEIIDDNTTGSGADSVASVTMEKAGGVLVHEACSLKFSRDSVYTNTQISMALLNEDESWPKDKYSQKSPIFAFQPNNLHISKPAKCSIPCWYVSYSPEVRANDKISVVQKRGGTWVLIHEDNIGNHPKTISCKISDLSPIALAIPTEKRNEIATKLYLDAEANFRVFFFGMKNRETITATAKSGRYTVMSDINILTVPAQCRIKVTLSLASGTVIGCLTFNSKDLAGGLKSKTFSGPRVDSSETKTQIRYKVQVNGETKIDDDFSTNLNNPGRPDTAHHGPVVINRANNGVGGKFNLNGSDESC